MDFQLLFKYEDSSLICNHCVKKLRPFSSGDPLYDEHYHELYEIIFVRTGTMDYCVGGQCFPITANSLMFTRPGITHAICSDTDSVYDRIDLRAAFHPVNRLDRGTSGLLAVAERAGDEREGLTVCEVANRPATLKLREDMVDLLTGKVHSAGRMDIAPYGVHILEKQK